MRILLYMILGIFTLSLGSCGVNNNIMFKTPKDIELASDTIMLAPPVDYLISVDDRIAFTLATNNGEGIVQSLSLGGLINSMSSTDYIVREDGNTELPLLGKVQVKGLTTFQCEDTLEMLFARHYQNPFVQVKITSQRVLVFSGNGSSATVVSLTNTNTTLLEVIAQAGGIQERGKANTIKVIRKFGNERKIFVVDLSTIEGLQYADMIVQANDFIYIEPRPYLLREFLQETAPVLSLISTTLSFVAILNLIK
ncbi:MAG: polysaccharide biosynthesis/export family protein [Flavobacteriia bacterium]